VNRQELIAQLESAGVGPQSYSVTHGRSDDCYCLTSSDGMFTTFYWERGERREVREFATEDEACQHFLRWILRDPTTRRR
jgi:hypothetical protein